MLKSIQTIIFKIIYFFLITIETILKRNILLRFKEFLEKKSYTNKIVCNNEISFFTPNELIKWRVDTILDKEPETIQWIDEFEDNSIFWDIGSNIGLYSIYAALKKDKIKIYFLNHQPLI